MPSQPHEKELAIATGVVVDPGQENKASATSGSSVTTGTTEATPKAKTPTAPEAEEASVTSASPSQTTAGQRNEPGERDHTSQSQAEKAEIESSTSMGATASSHRHNNSASQANSPSSNIQASTAEGSATNLERELLTTPVDGEATTESETAIDSNQNSVLQNDASSEATTEETSPNETTMTQQNEEATTAQDETTMGKDGQVQVVLLPQDNLTTATRVESPEFSRSGSLVQDAADLYEFSVEETGIFTATLSDLSADADVQLIQDKNDNGQVDAGEILAWEWEQGSKDESIRHFLGEGDYVLRVLEQDISPEPTDYGVTTTFEAAETDNRAFSINVVYQRGVEALNDQAKAAVEQAADYWENIISYSSFDRPLELALGIYGTRSTTNPFLAYAGPYSYLNTGETGVDSTRDKLLPIVGVAVLNTFYLDEYNSNPDYLESVLRHEIGHALGIGIIWNQRGNDLVDQDTGVYRADTYAGQSYGDLLGTGIATEIPLDQESLTHWDEDTFDTELMTPQAEGIGNPLPLSQLTISSLRDIGWHVNYGAAEAFSLDSSAIA